MTRFGWLIAGIGLLAVIAVGWTFRQTLFGHAQQEEPHAGHGHESEVDYWTCPMHPSVKAKESGPCPICGMDLQPVPKAQPATTQGDIDYWTCPMHPSVKAKEPGPCPICGMDLQPVPKAGATGMGAGAQVPGFIRLSSWQQQLIGVTTAPVERRALQTTLRTVGRIDYDETRFADVNLKVNGWIQKLYVDYTGKPVKQGQPLFALYSPELVSTQEEYLLALQAEKMLKAGEPADVVIENTGEIPGQNSAFESTRQEGIVRTHSLLEAARRRLLLWDLTEAQIQNLAQTGKPQTTITIYAPASGVVTDKMAVEGMYVTPGMRLYRIAALDTVWVQADVYEYELAFVHEGQTAEMTLPYLPEQRFEGTVDYIYPYLDRKTRTAQIRIKVPNPNLRLRPDMFADVLLNANAGTQLALPESAVLFSGRRRIAFVDAGEGRYQPREIRVGVRLDNYYHVIEGLQAGERVVTSANFLLDSESRLKNVMAGMAP